MPTTRAPSPRRFTPRFLLGVHGVFPGLRDGEGGLLTMLSQAGSGTLAGNAHAETFQQIARSDAVVLSGVLQRGIDVPLLTEFFPGQPVQAYFEFAPGASAESARVVEDAVRLARAGYRMDAEVLSEKTGYAFAPEAGVGSVE